MDIPQAKPFKADKTYADSNVYSLDGFDGFFRRVRKPGNGSVLAVYDTDALRTGHFVEVFASDLSDAKGKPAHAPGPSARIEKPEEILI